MRVGQGPLERVIFPLELGLELLERCGENFEAAGIELGHRGRPLQNPQPGPPLGSGLREREGAGLEVERCQVLLAGQLRARILPMQAAGDH